MKLKIFTVIVFSILVCRAQLSQSIINTIGTNGFFIVRDSLNSQFFTVSQSTGEVKIIRNFRMENTLSQSIGVITKANSRFLHNYGTNNVFLGLNSGNFTMSGSSNAALGFLTLSANTTGYYNSAFGSQSLSANTTGYSDVAFGYQSLNSNTTGNGNIATGVQSLYLNTAGNYNSALGYRAMYWNSTGNENVGLGYQSLYYNSTGSYNTALGSYSLNINSGQYNTAIGYLSGSLNEQGNNNTTIGSNAQVPNGMLSNQVRIGDIFVTYAGVQVPWTITSDRRWKDNITGTNLGLGFINKLRPVSYTRKNDESHKTEYGLIAQEVEEVLKEEGIENAGMLTVTDKGEYELRYNDLLAPMIKAIQELKSENDELKERLNKYENMQKAMLEEIEMMRTNTQIVNNK